MYLAIMIQAASSYTSNDSDTIANSRADQQAADRYIGLSALLKAAADPLRLEILRVLAKGSYGVLELAYLFDLKQSAMSHHLKVLAKAQLVTTRREGNSIFYRRNQPLFQTANANTDDNAHKDIFTALFKNLDDFSLTIETQQRLQTIQRDRATASQEFFAANAHKFREQQDLIASYPVYGEHVKTLLSQVNFSSQETALEIGPGEGEFLPILCQQFKHVIALDNSIEMLNKAKALATEQALNNIDFVLGDTQTATQKNIFADCIIINMVLHHVPSPEELFQDAATLLNQNGSLLVTDLCRHDQEWVTESCGDLWLGFEPTEFSHWANAAGLKEGQNQFFALRNGFQIQLRHFVKGNP